jgi:hypothetical protein
MPNKTIRFYSEKEIEILKRVATNKKSHEENIAYLSKVLKRPITGVAAKYLNVRREMGVARKHTKTIDKEIKSKSIEFPKDITLEFSSKKVLIQNDKIIIYFK